MKRQSDIGWFELIMGLILIILGIVIMRQPVGVFTWIVILCGVIAVISGIAHPGAGTWAIAMILPIWIIAHCISRLSHLQYMKMHFGMTYYTISLILNILGLIVGILLIFRPMITILSMGVLVGAFLIIEGAECIVVALTGGRYYR